ncbi:unnamed protein product [Alopecurus aequalis]
MARGNRQRRSNPTPPPLPHGAPLQELDAAAAGGKREDVLALWKNAAEHLRRGTHAKALRILQKAMDKLGGLESSPPLLLLAYSTALELTAAVCTDRKIRARHFKSAIEASRRATEVAPDSAVLAHFYANVLLGASTDMHDNDAIAAYPSIIAECERGIQIQEPSDPALYYLGQMDSEHPTAEEVIADLRKLQQLVSEDLQGMKIAEFQRQQHASAAGASLAPSIAGHCADERKGGLEQSCEVMNDSGICKGQGSSVPQDNAGGETSGKIQTRLDSDDFGCNFSTTDAYPNGQEEETPAEETLECQVRIKDELNLKQFAEQSTSTSTPFEFDNGTIPSDTVCIHDDNDDGDHDRCFLQDLHKSIERISIVEEVRGSGLKSDDDDKNCLLNVIIQSLWHIRGLRDELLETSPHHKHVGDPRVVSCVVCALCYIFIELGKVSKGKGEAVAPTTLRMALSTSSPTETLFPTGHVNDASEVLEAILRRVHDSTGSLQRVMRMCLDNTFDDLLKTVIMDGHRTCDPDVGGCGKSDHISHTLSSSPHVFTVVLGWQTGHGSVSDTLLSDTLAAIGTEIDIRVIYPGTPRSKHSLVSVACLYSQRYICFAVDGEHWVLYDDQTAKVVGDWIQVLIMCEEKKMQPLVFFFEAAN